MEIEHFSHDHRLILEAEEMEDGKSVICYGCQKPISGLSYGCKGCMFFLHISCAQLPKEFVHPSHSEHPLSLLPNTSYTYFGRNYCEVCRASCNRFLYSCETCHFYMDIKCASMAINAQKRIKHKGHEHELMPLEKPVALDCDACGAKHKEEESSYLCTTCGFWISQRCASLPATIEAPSMNIIDSGQIRALTLAYSPLPGIDFSPLCQNCKKMIKRNTWFYFSTPKYFWTLRNCYFTHIHCVTPSILQSPRDYKADIELKDLGLTWSDIYRYRNAAERSKPLQSNKAIILPVLNTHVDITSQYLVLVQGEYTRKEEIRHFSHPHLLILSDDKVSDHLRCNFCRDLILLAPFYHCTSACKFFLHETCAKLPDKVQHPCHPRHSILFVKELPPKPYKNPYYQCFCCRLYFDASMYCCSDCHFYLDPKCAFLPRAIKHEAHQHTLAPRQVLGSSCSVCLSGRDVLFLCDLCQFGLCIWCAILPRQVSHRYDSHPFTLKYKQSVREFPDEDFCEICLDLITSKEWYYDCAECDQSLHTRCIRPIDTLGRLESLDNKHSFSGKTFFHEHEFSAVPPPKRPPPCIICRKLVFTHIALHCLTCNTWMHEDCYLYK